MTIRPPDRSTQRAPLTSAAPAPAAPGQPAGATPARSEATAASDRFNQAAARGSAPATDAAAHDNALELRMARRLAAADKAVSEGSQKLFDKGFRAVERTLGRPAAMEITAAASLGYLALAVPTALVAGTVGAAVNGIMGGMPERYLDRLADQMDQVSGDR